MPSVRALLVLTTAALGACLGAGRAPSQPLPAMTAIADTSRADLLVEQGDTGVSIRGIFRNAGEWEGALTYRLEATKHGPSGTSTSRQSGSFESQPGATDTLSAVRLGTRPGDRLSLHLTIHSGGRLVDEVHAERSF